MLANVQPGPSDAANVVIEDDHVGLMSPHTVVIAAASPQVTVGPAAMTLGGMLKQLARFEDDMSAEWLQGGGQLSPWDTVDWDTNPDWDWRTAVDDTTEQLYGLWRNAVARSRSLFATALVESGPERRGSEGTGVGGERPSLRYNLLTMIEEYARHNGHADLLRESVDGLVAYDRPG